MSYASRSTTAARPHAAPARAGWRLPAQRPFAAEPAPSAGSAGDFAHRFDAIAIRRQHAGRAGADAAGPIQCCRVCPDPTCLHGEKCGKLQHIEPRGGANPSKRTKKNARIDDPTKFGAAETADVSAFVAAGGTNVKGTTSAHQVDMAHRLGDLGMRRMYDDMIGTATGTSGSAAAAAAASSASFSAPATSASAAASASSAASAFSAAPVAAAPSAPAPAAIVAHSQQLLAATWNPSQQTAAQNRTVHAGQAAFARMVNRGSASPGSLSAVNRMVRTVSTSSDMNLRPGSHPTNISIQEEPDLVAHVSGSAAGALSPTSSGIADVIDQHGSMFPQRPETTLPPAIHRDPATGAWLAAPGYRHSGGTVPMPGPAGPAASAAASGAASTASSTGAASGGPLPAVVSPTSASALAQAAPLLSFPPPPPPRVLARPPAGLRVARPQPAAPDPFIAALAAAAAAPRGPHHGSASASSSGGGLGTSSAGAVTSSPSLLSGLASPAPFSGGALGGHHGSMAASGSGGSLGTASAGSAYSPPSHLSGLGSPGPFGGGAMGGLGDSMVDGDSGGSMGTASAGSVLSSPSHFTGSLSPGPLGSGAAAPHAHAMAPQPAPPAHGMLAMGQPAAPHAHGMPAAAAAMGPGPGPMPMPLPWEPEPLPPLFPELEDLGPTGMDH